MLTRIWSTRQRIYTAEQIFYFHSVTFHVGTGQIVHHAPLFSTLAFIAIHMAIFCNGVQLY